MNLNYNFLEKLLKLNKSEKDELLENLISKIEVIHSEKSNEKKWIEIYHTELNLSLYKHGLIKKPGLDDYIVTDYIKDNMYILKNRELSRVIHDNSLLNIYFDDSQIIINSSDKFEDKIKDYVDLNVIAYYDSDFASKFLTKILNNNNRNKYLKIFSIYSAKYYIDLMILINEVKSISEKEELQQIIEFIFDSFEEFTNYIPKWLNRKIDNK